MIDDEPIIRKVLERAFKGYGHEVILAENGAEGIQKWKASLPDVVILDVLMPVMSGLEVLDALDFQTSAKIVVISAFTGEGSEAIKRRENVSLFLQKPFGNIFEIVASILKLVT
ncbi:MAG: response regulator [Bdellovibrionales bacterium]|nr:response regulator [Bdellovibrionales bacterium]